MYIKLEKWSREIIGRKSKEQNANLLKSPQKISYGVPACGQALTKSMLWTALPVMVAWHYWWQKQYWVRRIAWRNLNAFYNFVVSISCSPTTISGPVTWFLLLFYLSFRLFWLAILKLACITDSTFAMLFLVIGFIYLVAEIQFMLLTAIPEKVKRSHFFLLNWRFISDRSILQ